mgnify:FL=1
MTNYETSSENKILAPLDLALPFNLLKPPLDEAKRRRAADTDGTKRRAQEIRARNRLI